MKQKFTETNNTTQEQFQGGVMQITEKLHLLPQHLYIIGNHEQFCK
jgi:hypothetical protein